MADGSPTVLAVADFSGNPTKVERHLGPLAATADPTVVCTSTGDADVDGLDALTVPDGGWRPLGLALMGLRALVAARRGDYDAVVSFSLLPHGCIALAAARLAGLPVHLGTIGADLDVHAEARYAPVVRALLRRFDVVSAPGSVHAARLESMGVERAVVLRNPVDVERFAPAGDGDGGVVGDTTSGDAMAEDATAGDATAGDAAADTTGEDATATADAAAADATADGGAVADASADAMAANDASGEAPIRATTDDPEYDLLWVGRFSAEKDPLLFVRTVAALRERGRPVAAAMVGDGPMGDEVRAAVERRGLEDAIALPGWVDDPSGWYRRARTFVLTSRRDALPLTLVEAMASGVAPVAPPVGNVPDLVADGETGVLADRDPAHLADAVAGLLDDDERRSRLARAAAAAGAEHSLDAAADDWDDVLAALGVGAE